MGLKEKVLAWAKQRFGDTPYAKNFELMKIAYEREFGPLPVKVNELEDMVGEVATVEVMVVSRDEKFDRTYKGDPETYKKCDDPDAPNCVELAWRVYTAGDDTGVLRLTLPPWLEEGFRVGSIYKVRGRVKKFRDRLEMTVLEFTEVENPLEKKAIEVARDFMELKGWRVETKEFEEFMRAEGFGEYIEKAKVELGLRKEGTYLVGKGSDEDEEA